AILLLQKTAFTCLKDYEQQQAQGLDPTFDPKKLGIKHADYWEKSHQDQAVAPVALSKDAATTEADKSSSC
ncbi:MAG: sodium:alanine symporter, partial [Shewanella sp.]